MQPTLSTPRKPRSISLGYEAREQFIPFHLREQRWACLVAHRRAGKTVACVMDLLDAAVRCDKKVKKDGRFGYVAPFYVQAKDAAWTYAKRFAMLIPGAEINESELRIDFAHNGARLRLYGADNYDRMRGSYFDGVILDEYGDMHPAAWPEVVRPMLADRRGWAVFIGTPKGRNDFHAIWEKAGQEEGWFRLMLKSSDSGLIDDDEVEEIRKTLTPEQFEQEMECNFDAAIQGAYYGKEIVEAERLGRIGVVDVDPALPVHTAWDLGIGDSTAIWFFQVAPDGIRVVDFYENHGQGLPHYASELRARGYVYGDDFVPHDARARELGTGRTRVETLIDLGRKPRLVPGHTVMDGINAARVSFPSFWFAGERCKPGIEALRQYRAEYDEKTKAFKNNPRHDWTSHAADAFRYMAMAWKELKAPVVKPKPQDKLIYTADVYGRLHANMDVKDIIAAMKRKKRVG